MKTGLTVLSVNILFHILSPLLFTFVALLSAMVVTWGLSWLDYSLDINKLAVVVGFIYGFFKPFTIEFKPL